MTHATNDEKARETQFPESIKPVLEALEHAYWVPTLRTPFGALEEVAAHTGQDCPALHAPFAAFCSNLSSARELLEFPYLLISPLLLADTPIGKRLRDVQNSLESGEDAISKEPALVEEIVSTVLEKTQLHFSNRRELNRLMHQACLLAWSAFETYCKEVFVAAVNQRPALYSALLKVQPLKERFAVSTSGWPGLLEAHGYDLNGKLGTIIGADKDFSSPQLIRDLFPALLKEVDGSEEFLLHFARDELWLLGHRRHLIAHRCGVVDEEYLRKTHDKEQEKGKLLKLRGRDVAEGMGAVAGCAIALYGKARYCWPRASSEE